MTNGEFLEDLRGMMRSWNWSEEQIEKGLPHVLEACIQVGIVTPMKDGFRITELVDDDAAWERVWALLEKRREGDLVGDGRAS